MVNKLHLLDYYLLLTSFGFFVSAKKELKLLHVLSANKFYVPDYNDTSLVLNIPNNFTYIYFLENAVDVPTSVKVQLFKLGVYLRQTYNGFIPSMFLDDITEMRTTQFSVSIIAGELINTGLWPPVGEQIWNEDFLWQPIPFEYDVAEEDTLLLGTLCPTFQYETYKVLKRHNLTLPQQKLLKYLRDEGGVNVTNPIDVALFYLTLENSNELNQIHPDWLKKIFPSENLLDLALTAYDLLSQTIIQKRLNGGTIIKKIINNSKDLISGVLTANRKIIVYSGDERNLAGVFKNLNIPLHALPSAGAGLIFELYAEDKNYFVKVNYYTGELQETIPYVLQGCELFCPLEKFEDLVKDVLPENELSLCGSMIEPPNVISPGVIGSGEDSVHNILISYVLLLFFSFVFSYTCLNIL